MRILLTANASYDPPRGGATRSNLVWLRHLESAGHACRMVCGGAQSRRVQALREQILEWRPDWVLVSSEDLGHALLRETHHSAPGRVVYLAHTPQFYPFGPASWNPDRHAAELVARSAGIVAIGRHMARSCQVSARSPSLLCSMYSASFAPLLWVVPFAIMAGLYVPQSPG